MRDARSRRSQPWNGDALDINMLRNGIYIHCTTSKQLRVRVVADKSNPRLCHIRDNIQQDKFATSVSVYDILQRTLVQLQGSANTTKGTDIDVQTPVIAKQICASNA